MHAQMSVSDIMTPEVVTVDAETGMADALEVMVRRRISCLVVTEAGRPAGIFTERDAVRLYRERGAGVLGVAVGTVGSRPVRGVTPDTPLGELEALFRSGGTRGAVVVDGEGRLVGLVTEHDLVSGIRNDYVADLRRLVLEQAVRLAELDRRLSEQALLERQVAERTAELAVANHELEAFTYSISHELRAPLRAMNGFGEALVEDYGECLGAEGRDRVRRVVAAAHRMGALIDGLLNLSRVSRGELHSEPVHLSRLARAAAARQRTAHPDRGLAFDIAPGLVARGDPRLLEVVMENLIDNAVKYTAGVAQARIRVGARSDDGQRVFFVSDNGEGFDPAYVHKLFQPFERLHPATRFEGTGVGLATVQRIIGRHGGRVWAQGRVGEGATFYFTLSRVPDPAPQ
jgi:signal transduction histidine kinase